MVKYISIFQLKQGYDAEETYQIWIKEHVPYVKKTMEPELKGYVVGRVVQNRTEGKEFFGSVQLSFSNLSDAIRAWSRLAENPPDELMNRITDVRRVIVEENDVFA